MRAEHVGILLRDFLQRFQAVDRETGTHDVDATQAFARAIPAGQPAVGVTVYPSGDGLLPNHPTVITVRECQSNYDCTVTAPACDERLSPHRCTSALW